MYNTTGKETKSCDRIENTLLKRVLVSVLEKMHQTGPQNTEWDTAKCKLSSRQLLVNNYENAH